MNAMTLTHLQTLVAHMRRYQTDKAARALAEQRMQAAFGPGANVTEADVKAMQEPIKQPAMAVAGN